ncbi:MAG: CPBP family intramembrane glutamic endopeptidase [Candidatus Acidiferrales bacterium]
MLSSFAMHWDFAVILLILAVAVPLLGRRRVRQLMLLPATSKTDRLVLYASTLAFQWIAVAVILWRTFARGTRAAQLGLALPKPSLTIAAAILLAVLFLANQMISLRRMALPAGDPQGLLMQLARKLFPQDHSERLAFFALVVTVAICEELIYRGFVQRVFQDWAGDDALVGIAASAVFFSLAHLYQGRRGLISTLIVGVLFSAVRDVTGSLLAPVFAHFVTDLTVGILAPLRMRKLVCSEVKAGEGVD